MAIGRAIVVGAGIGGLASAIALRRAGFDVSVHEQQPDLQKTLVGGGIHMWTNAMRALRALGLDDRVAELGAPLRVTEYHTSSGKLLATWPIGEIAAEQGLTDVGIARGDLQTVLVGAQAERDIRTGRRCTGFDQRPDGVIVHFEDGDERADVLIGADGLRSTVRPILHGDGPPRYAGYAQLQTLVEGGSDLLPVGVERVVFGRRQRAVLHHAGHDRLFWAVAVYGPEGTLRPDPGIRETLLARFREWPAPIPQAIESASDESIVGFDIYDRDPLDRWGEGRVTLLGDAAHAMTTNLSQGGCQALEDAVVLADALGSATDVETGLRAYEAARIPRTSALVKQSRAIARAGGIRNALVCAARDRFFGFGLKTIARRAHRGFVRGGP